MTRTRVEAGVCGFTTTIEAQSEDEQHVAFKVESDCERIRRLAGKLVVVDGYAEIKDGFEGVLYRTIRQELTGCCAGCAVPVGLFKSMQVAAKLALPKDVRISIADSPERPPG